MTARRSFVATATLAGLLSACGGPPPPVPPAAPKPPIAAAAPATTAASPTATTPPPTMPEIPKYEAKDRRDPFARLDIKEGAAGSTISTARLTGIVHSAKATLALVETPEGIGYILKPGDTLGDGRLLEIGSDSVVFQVTPKSGTSTNRVILKLATN